MMFKHGTPGLGCATAVVGVNSCTTQQAPAVARAVTPSRFVVRDMFLSSFALRDVYASGRTYPRVGRLPGAPFLRFIELLQRRGGSVTERPRCRISSRKAV